MNLYPFFLGIFLFSSCFSQGLKSLYSEDMFIINRFYDKKNSNYHPFLFINPNLYFDTDLSKQVIYKICPKDTAIYSLPNFIFKYTDLFFNNNDLWIKNVNLLKKVNLISSQEDHYYSNFSLQNLNEKYLLFNKFNDFLFLIQYLLKINRKKETYYLYNFEKISNHKKFKKICVTDKQSKTKIEYKKIKRMGLEKKLRIPYYLTKNKKLNLHFQIPIQDLKGNLFIASTSFSNKIYLYELNNKNSKPQIIEQKGYFFSDSLISDLKHKVDYSLKPSSYCDLFIDTLNQNFYRTYYVGIQDTITIDDDITHKHPVYLQVFSLDDIQFKYEIPLKTFRNFTLPKMFYAEPKKLWFHCESEHQFLIFSIKIE